MQINNDNSVVIISIPRLCVPAEQADEFVMMANKFHNDIKNTMIQIDDANRLEYDSYYTNGEFIPAVKKVNSYTGVLNQVVDVEQLDKYIEIGPDEKYVNSADVYKLWHPEVEDGEESQETEE